MLLALSNRHSFLQDLEIEKRQNRKVEQIEQEEIKKITVQINEAERNEPLNSVLGLVSRLKILWASRI